MTELTTPSGLSGVLPVAGQHRQPPRLAPECSQASALITEQQVRFATVAAMPVPRRLVTQWWFVVVRAVTVTTRSRASDVEGSSGRTRPRHYPSRWSGYLENACMSREMDRL